MAKYSIEDTTLSAIADAIRSKTGSADTIAVNQFPSAISALSTGGKIETGTTKVSGSGYVDFSFTAVGDNAVVVYILVDGVNTMFCYSLPVQSTGIREWVGQRYTSEGVDNEASISATLNGDICTVRWYVDPYDYGYWSLSSNYYLITA